MTDQHIAAVDPDDARDECVRRNAAVVKYVPTGVPVRPLDLPDPRLGRSGSVR